MSSEHYDDDDRYGSTTVRGDTVVFDKEGGSGCWIQFGPTDVVDVKKNR